MGMRWVVMMEWIVSWDEAMLCIEEDDADDVYCR